LSLGLVDSFLFETDKNWAREGTLSFLASLALPSLPFLSPYNEPPVLTIVRSLIRLASSDSSCLGDGFSYIDLPEPLGRVSFAICMDINPKDFTAPWDAYELSTFVQKSAFRSSSSFFFLLLLLLNSLLLAFPPPASIRGDRTCLTDPNWRRSCFTASSPLDRRRRHPRPVDEYVI
jgi:hypothetical protein